MRTLLIFLPLLAAPFFHHPAAADHATDAAASVKTRDLSYLLRDCRRCHGPDGPDKKLFSAAGTLLPVDRAGLAKLVDGASRSLVGNRAKPLDAARVADVKEAIRVMREELRR